MVNDTTTNPDPNADKGAEQGNGTASDTTNATAGADANKPATTDGTSASGAASTAADDASGNGSSAAPADAQKGATASSDAKSADDASAGKTTETPKAAWVQALHDLHDASHQLLRAADGEATAAGTFVNEELDKAYYLIKDGFDKAVKFLEGKGDDSGGTEEKTDA